MESQNLTTATTTETGSTDPNSATDPSPTISTDGASASNNDTETTSNIPPIASGSEERPISSSRARECPLEHITTMLVALPSVPGSVSHHRVQFAFPPLYYEFLRQERERYLTFFMQLPVWNVPFMNPKDLASAGFFYFGDRDLVQCAFCRGMVGSWEVGDVPLAEHRRHFPKCRFVCNLPVGNLTFEEGSLQGDESGVMEALYDYDSEHRRRSELPPWPTARFNRPGWGQGHDVCGPFGRPSTISRASTSSDPGSVRGALPISTRSDDVASLTIRTGTGPARKNFVTLSSRIKTFTDWPVKDKSPEIMAEAGFYYIGPKDHVKCFYCDGGLKNWEIDDDAWAEHARWFGNCPYVLLNKGRDYIQQVSAAKPLIVNEKPKNSGGNSLMGAGPREVTDAELMLLINSPPVQAVLHMGVDLDKVKLALRRKIQQTGNSFHSTDELLDLVLSDSEYESDSDSDDENGEDGDLDLAMAPGMVAAVLEGLMDEVVEETNALSLANESVEETNAPGLANEMVEGSNIRIPTEGEGSSSESGNESSSADVEEIIEKALASRTSSDDSGTGPVASNSNPQDEVEHQLTDVKKALELKDEEIRELKEARQCKICMDNEVGVVFLPCGHLVSCVRCATALSDCALCRQPIKAVVRTYLS